MCFAQSALEWPLLQQWMLPSGIFATAAAHVAPYTRGLCLFLYSFHYEVVGIILLNPSKSQQAQWLLWVGLSSSLGEMATSWSSSCKTSSGWSQLAMNTHLYLPEWPAILTSAGEELFCAADVSWPLTETPSVNLEVHAQSTTSHTDGFQHCTPCCWFLILNPALHALTH